jgi:DNA-binding CsgD family transcriptional regulator
LSHHLRLLAAMSQGNYEEALVHADAICPIGTIPAYSPTALVVGMDLVDAAVRSGRPAEATAHVTAMKKANLAALSPRKALLVAGAAAVAAADDKAPQLFEEALALPATERWQFDVARVHLAYGERLRRMHGSTTVARTHLNLAADTFKSLKAIPWSARAANELRATGVAKQAQIGQGSVALTAQEYEIATLAAAGLTNKQIAQRLYLSPRTIGAHLYRAYPKLGISSRAALRDALNGLQDDISRPS